MWAERTLLGDYIITIDPIKYKDATDMQIAGVLPHEFVHFSEFKKWNPIKGLTISFLQKISKKFKEYMEKETDKETIRRGFAKQLYANRSFRFKTSSEEYKKSILCFYLNPSEIKNYAKSIKKW